MPIPAELQAAQDRMKAAQEAMIDFIDAGGGDINVRYALLGEINDSLANFQQVLQRMMSQWQSN
jgi:hypothetical protein